MGWGNSVKGPELADLKATIENLQVALSSDDYINGMDQEGTIQMVRGLYSYVTGRLSTGLPIPAPADNPDDKHRIIWPDGIKIKSRRGSVVSAGSGKYVMKDRYGNAVAGAGVHTHSRVSSVTSTSKYSSRYVGIAEEEQEDSAPVRQPPPRRDSFRRQVPQDPAEYMRSKKQVSYDPESYEEELPLRVPASNRRPTGTHRVNDAAMKPSASIERFMDQADANGKNPWEEPEEERRPVRRSKAPPRKSQSKFADDDIE